MTEQPMVDQQQLRQVLGHYPTGVTVITAVDEHGEPSGMVLGSFTSVSLDPPLVAYLPQKTSSSYARLRSSTSFCVNVLSVDQEELCRRFASKADDKFRDVAWRPAPGGAPVLEGALAWLDCEVARTVDAGDHDIVLGRVRDLGLQGPGSPLLFFQGGYGGFDPGTLVAPYAADLRDQLRVADLSRGPMERIAHELGLECYAQAVVGGDLVIMAGAGLSAGSYRAHVGRRLPFVPPYGALFLGGLEDREATATWTSYSSGDLPTGTLAECRRMLDRVRDRGWSIGLVAPDHDTVWEEIVGHADDPVLSRRTGPLVETLTPYYEPAEIAADGEYDVRILAAPVHAPDGRVIETLALWGMPPGASGAEVRHWLDRLLAAAREVSASVADQDAGGSTSSTRTRSGSST
ncbi:MAG TPA: flavin reductase [Nocardioides sp.]|uniref:flavin reductase n=1 Tax=Nocardioides sp. TaxID=35761 RepID=UPI002BF22661|nr:flavin reductase [Nocardioides sp.]HTW15327.1 flavin reductase [Nocardioides sp.]